MAPAHRYRDNAPRGARHPIRTRVLGLGAVCAVAVAAAGCSSTAPSSGAGSASSGGSGSSAPGSGHAAKGKINVALVTINETAAFFTQMNAGASAEANKLGVNLVINNPDNSVSNQNTAVEDYANENFNAVIADSIAGGSISPALAYARKHGTKVVAVDSIVNSPAVQSQIAVSNEGAGRMLGNYFVTWAKTHLSGGVGKIGVVGALNSPIQVQRQAGFVDVVKASGSKILQVVNGQNVEATAQSQAQDLTTAQPGMTALYNTGEPANLGAISAIKQAGKAGKVPIFGWDLDATGIAAIKDGTEIAAIQQEPYQEGVQAVQSAVKLARGKPAPTNITAPATVVTKANVGSIKPY
ncbi:MAG: substrate-binding domain-containing protein [Actinomycetota bacterium]|nr:substrate-binding domain-containing protein [Actinomycetota bacterium]